MHERQPLLEPQQWTVALPPKLRPNFVGNLMISSFGDFRGVTARA
jgi:hypothetical protein